MVHRQGASPAHSGPIRTCVGCRCRALAVELLRVVVADGGLVPDPRRRLPGRGAWLHPDLVCLRSAERRRALPRALRVPGPLDVARLRAHLEQVAQTNPTRETFPRPAPEGSRSTRHESAVKLKP